MKIIKSIYPSITVQRKPPLNLQAGDEQYFGGPEYKYKTPASNLLYYNNVTVTKDGIIIKNLVPQKDLIVNYQNDFKNYRYKYLAHAFLKYKNIVLPKENKYMLIFDNYSGPKGLAHWYHDSLTRLVEIKDIIHNYIALVPYYYKENVFIHDSLKLFGIKNIYCIEKGTRVKIKNLYVPSHIAESGNFNPENTDKLRQFIWEKSSGNLNFSLGEKIYISRSRAAFRYIANEKEVVDLLSQYGFKVVYMEDYNLAEKISMVYNTKYMVSIIGAAFSFIHFMKPNSTILEFRKNKDGNAVFYSLADANGLNYYYQFCEAIVYHMPSQNFNLIVDIDKLKKNIETMLSK